MSNKKISTLKLTFSTKCIVNILKTQNIVRNPRNHYINTAGKRWKHENSENWSSTKYCQILISVWSAIYKKTCKLSDILLQFSSTIQHKGLVTLNTVRWSLPTQKIIRPQQNSRDYIQSFVVRLCDLVEQTANYPLF